MTRSLVRGRVQGKGVCSACVTPALYHGEGRRVVSPGAPGGVESSIMRDDVVMKPGADAKRPRPPPPKAE